MPKLLLLPLRLLLLLATPTTLYKTLNATGYVTVVSLLVALLLPHCLYADNHHVTITRRAIRVYCGLRCCRSGYDIYLAFFCF
nr:MAG TPA: hypothetical protein [Caudoviricetes sp.]